MIEKPTPLLLVVEDSDEDYEVLKRLMKRYCDLQIPMQRCVDGEEALEFLLQESKRAERSQGTLPNLILLDLNLPGTDGREVLNEIRQNAYLKTIPVVILTTSSNPKDVDSCYRSGANAYMIKPTDIEQFKISIQQFVNYWFKTVVMPESSAASL